MDDTGMIECLAEPRVFSVEPDRPEVKRKRNPPPQVETIFPLEDFTNDKVMTDESRGYFKV